MATLQTVWKRISNEVCVAYLVLGKIQLHFGWLAGAVPIGQGACAPGAAAAGLLIAVQRRPKPVPVACQPSPLIQKRAPPWDTAAICFCMHLCWCIANDTLAVEHALRISCTWTEPFFLHVLQICPRRILGILGVDVDMSLTRQGRRSCHGGRHCSELRA